MTLTTEGKLRTAETHFHFLELLGLEPGEKCAQAIVSSAIGQFVSQLEKATPCMLISHGRSDIFVELDPAKPSRCKSR